MLDIQLLIEDKGGNPEVIRESQRRRGANVEIVDEIIALYKEWTTSKSRLCWRTHHPQMTGCLNL
jgi:seryl-tRNA synthetase